MAQSRAKLVQEGKDGHCAEEDDDALGGKTPGPA